MNFASCALWSITIFDRFKISDYLSEEEGDFSGPIELLDENDIFLSLLFFFFTLWRRSV